jgi:hypothetical protein
VKSISFALRGPTSQGCAKYSTPLTPRIGEHRVFGCDDHVGNPQQHESTSDCLALRGGDDGFREVAPPPTHVEVDLFFPCHVTLLAFTTKSAVRKDKTEFLVALGVAHVVSRAEVRAFRAEHDDLHVAATCGIGEGRLELVGHALVLRVACLGTVEGDDCDAVLAGILDLVVDRLQILQVNCHERAFRWGCSGVT